MDVNRCPFNNIKGFYDLCKDMNINIEKNCYKIDYDSANNIKIKVILYGALKTEYSNF